MKSEIQSVEVDLFVHATEDPGKLVRAVADLLGSDRAPVEERLDGHFGNAIVSMKLHLTGEEAERAVKRIFSSLPKELKGVLGADMEKFVDEHAALFLRFDKQRLVLGRLVLGGGDALRVKVKPRKFQMRSGGPQFYRRLLEESGVV
ncbi:MAG: hypothetical protein JRM73_03980 [Nitrososphaerota archaeon]|nr:hypothetical protein [Nitrososphaerota archaeon]